MNTASKQTVHGALMPSLRPVGLVTIGLAAGMLACAIWGFVSELTGHDRGAIDDKSWVPMVISALITAITGAAILKYSSKDTHPSKRRKSAILSVSLIWSACGLFGSLPYILDAHFAPIDALFETVSGFTTTGATIISDIETRLSQPLLLWRSLTQWLGGMGIVVLFVAVFPNVGVGAKHMFKNEVPGPSSEGLRPRISETSITLWKLYAALTGFGTLVFWLVFEMDLLTAICHAFTTFATGGFSTRDASIASFNDPGLELVIALFMLISGVNFALYFNALQTRSLKGFSRSTEFRVYTAIVVVSTLLVTVGAFEVHKNLFVALRYAFFTVCATLTGTGYGTDDYMAYHDSGLLIIVALMLVGGCAGSTAGGIKVSRVTILTKLAWNQIRQSLRPNLVQSVRMSGSSVPADVLNGVGAFILVFAISIVGGTLLLTISEGVPVQTAFGATLSCFSNVGPSPWHIGADNFAGYSGLGKLICSIAMVLGRLEFFALLVLLLPDFWRR